jgi:diguanylate cyclase
VQAEKVTDVLRLLERATVEHLAWLMRLHCRLMFPGEYGEASPPSPLAELRACPGDDLLAAMMKARAAMHQAGHNLLADAERRGAPASETYRAFMARVDEYSREARRAETQLRRALTETDPLTGVHNRQGMLRDLRKEWTRSMRTGRPCCVAIADLDHFKAINDTWGHAAGDRVLCQAAHFFQSQLRPYDMVYRYGGEEFLFCLPDTDADTARMVLDRLRGLLSLSRTRLACGTEVAVTCSIAVAAMRQGKTVQDTLAAADTALYVAKREGRDRVEVADEPPQSMMAYGGARG